MEEDVTSFTYHRATGRADALAHLSREGACAYAGGTDLLVALRHRAEWVAGVRHLVDIKDVDDARGIQLDGDMLRIGALTTARELVSSAVVRRTARVLSMAASQTSAPWLRARGTVGGNVMTPHPAGDIATALLALGAVAEFATRGRRRTERIPLADVMSPAATRLSGSLLLALHVPTTAHSWYERASRRLVFCRATVAVAAVHRGTHTQVALGGVAERPVLGSSAPPASPLTALVDALVERATHGASIATRRR